MSISWYKKCLSSHPRHIFVEIIFFFIHVVQKFSMKQFEIFSLKHAHVFLTILIIDCKVFKLERFSSVT